jgi:hypothetical protein
MTVADEVEFTVVRLTQHEVNDVRQRATSSAAHVLALTQAEADDLRGRSDSAPRVRTELRTAQEALHGSSRRPVPGWNSRDTRTGKPAEKRSEGE